MREVLRLFLICAFSSVIISCEKGGGGVETPDLHDEFTESERILSVVDPASNNASLDFKIIRRDYTNRTFADPDPQYEIFLEIIAKTDFPNGFSYTLENVSDLAVHMYTIKGSVASLANGATSAEGIISNNGVLLRFSRFAVIASTDSIAYTFRDPDMPAVSSAVVETPEPILSQCPTFSMNIRPENSSIYSCQAPDSATSTILRDVNSFWGSGIQACICGADIPPPFGAFCPGNAIVFPPQSGGLGFVYYNLDFLTNSAANFGTDIVPAQIMAHEAGHNIQNSSNMFYFSTVGKELGADCISGFYLGGLACQGRINTFDIQSVLANAGSSGGLSAYYDPTGHGSSQERINAVLLGVNGYLNGLNPIQVCN